CPSATKEVLTPRSTPPSGDRPPSGKIFPHAPARSLEPAGALDLLALLDARHRHPIEVRARTARQGSSGHGPDRQLELSWAGGSSRQIGRASCRERVLISSV